MKLSTFERIIRKVIIGNTNIEYHQLCRFKVITFFMYARYTCHERQCWNLLKRERQTTIISLTSMVVHTLQ